MLTYRTLFVVAVLVVCFGAAFWGYLEYDRHEFQKNLPVFKSESQTSKNDGFQAPTAQEKAEMSDLEEEPQPSTVQGNTSLNEGNLPDKEKHSEVSKNLLIEDTPVLDWVTETPSIEVSEHIWQDPNTSAINANELSPAEFEVHYRDQLRKEYGEIPEIDVYVKLHRRIVAERKPRTLDDQIQFDELSAFFYPSAENELAVQELKALRDQVGGDIIFMHAEDIPIEK